MGWTLCTHLGAAKSCTSNPGPTEVVYCVCQRPGVGTVLQIQRAHGPVHGRFLAISAPSGYAAAFQFQHDTTETQPNGACVSPPFDPPGTYPYQVLLVWAGGSVPIRVDTLPAECGDGF